MRALKVLFYSIITLVVIAFGVGRFVERNKITGEGEVLERTIDVSGFDEIEVGSTIEVYLRTDSAYGLTVMAQENLHDHIQVSVDGSVLELGTEGQISFSEPIRIWVSAPQIRALSCSGAARLFGQNVLNAEDIKIEMSGASSMDLEALVQVLDCELSGASELRIRGEAGETLIEASGASKYLGTGFSTRLLKVDISGAGMAELGVSEALDGKISGAGKVNYQGDPAVVDLDLSGAGSANQR